VNALFLDTRQPPMADALRNRVVFALTQRYPDCD